ncbi:CoA transferase [Nocardia nova]|nr:CoA transferase [Nocardia nova]
MTTDQGFPLAGVRVLELSAGQAGRTAGMLLADLGADVVRAVPEDWAPAAPDSPEGPQDLCWDRGKRFTPAADPAAVRRLARAADVVLDDASPGAERPTGLDSESLCASAPALVHVSMPPHGTVGRWRDLPADPLLTSAIGGFATFHPSHDPGTPIASAVPMVPAIQGALGSVLAVAGVFGARTTGHGRSLITTGLHACAAALSTLVVKGIDTDQVINPGGRMDSRPNFRIYRCADDRYLHLSALTVEFFLPALTALDRLDIMVMPGVDGEFLNVLRPEIGPAVSAELEQAFAQRPRDEWLEILGAAGVPCAPVLKREDWLKSDIVAHAAPPVELAHPEVGPVMLPGPPLTFSESASAIRHLPAAQFVPAAELWTDERPEVSRATPAPALPLAGLRILDISTFLAGPLVSTLMADLGAAVVKVEAPRGDPYAAYAASYAAVNHAKSIGALDLRDPDGHSALLQLAADADVLVDNLRPSVAHRLGVSDKSLRAGHPRLVHTSVSAFGATGPFVEMPGFDPVLQSRSGLAAAQGGDDEPVATLTPVLDVATGALAALGTLAALVERVTSGRGQHVTTSLTASSTFLQLAELTSYSGRPEAEAGGRDYRGPEPARRYHRAADGWLAIAATTAAQRRAVEFLVGQAPLTHEAVATALADHTVEHWVGVFTEAGVPVCAVPSPIGFLDQPYLADNDFSHVVRDPRFGRFRLIRGYFQRPDTHAHAAEWPEGVELLRRAGALRERYTLSDPEHDAIVV